MIAIPVPTWLRVNPDPGHVMHTLTVNGETQYLNAMFDVDNPFREFFNTVRDIGAVEAESDIRTMAQMVLELSRDVYCPQDSGALRASASVVESGSGMDYAAQVQYDTRYALYVHEDLTKHHEPPTQAKYLDRAVDEVVAMHGTGGGFGMVSQDVGGIHPVQIFNAVAHEVEIAHEGAIQVFSHLESSGGSGPSINSFNGVIGTGGLNLGGSRGRLGRRRPRRGR